MHLWKKVTEICVLEGFKDGARGNVEIRKGKETDSPQETLERNVDGHHIVSHRRPVF